MLLFPRCVWRTSSLSFPLGCAVDLFFTALLHFLLLLLLYFAARNRSFYPNHLACSSSSIQCLQGNALGLPASKQKNPSIAPFRSVPIVTLCIAPVSVSDSTARKADISSSVQEELSMPPLLRLLPQLLDSISPSFLHLCADSFSSMPSGSVSALDDR